jgi:eukaryotic-like serine/threonine-protein kinase
MLQPGQIICKRYKIIEKLASGGFGITYKAADQDRLDSLCVVKQFKPQSNANLQKARELFKREAQILQNLGDNYDNNNYIPRLLAYTEENGEFFLIQDYIDGYDLAKKINGKNKFTEADIIILLQKILIIINFIHQNQVIHRDLNPKNLMRRNDNQKIVVIDFGAVKEISNLVSGQQATIIGTDGYRPHEQEKGKPVFCSDIYAVGMTAIYALTGVQPDQLPENNNNEKIWRDRLDKNQNYHPKLLKILDKMIRHNYLERYQSAEEVLTDLKALNPDKPDKKDGKISKIIATISTTISIILIFLLLSKKQPEPIQIEKCNFQSYNYQNSTVKAQFNYKINICYPENWQIQENQDAFGSVAKFLSRAEGNNDKFQENVEIQIEKLDQKGVSLDTYTKNVLTEIKNNGDAKEVSAPIETTMANRKARKIIYKMEENGIKLKMMQVWTLYKNQAYVLTYKAEINKFDQYLKQVDLMIENLQILDK